MSLTKQQFETLRRPLNRTRVAHRSQGGKQLSYLESWDVRAHLIRVFGYGGFDIEVLDQYQIATREYASQGDNPKPMVECMWFSKVRLTVRDTEGNRLCRYTEAAVGATSGPATMIGEHHDNALKTAASDALKRCCINMGTQFGLSLYDDGSLADVVKRTIAPPPGVETEDPPLSADQTEVLRESLGAEIIDESPAQAPPEPVTEGATT